MSIADIVIQITLAAPLLGLFAIPSRRGRRP
jgi:hypothetical protein